MSHQGCCEEYNMEKQGNILFPLIWRLPERILSMATWYRGRGIEILGEKGDLDYRDEEEYKFVDYFLNSCLFYWRIKKINVHCRINVHTRIPLDWWLNFSRYWRDMLKRDPCQPKIRTVTKNSSVRKEPKSTGCGSLNLWLALPDSGESIREAAHSSFLSGPATKKGGGLMPFH